MFKYNTPIHYAKNWRLVPTVEHKLFLQNLNVNGIYQHKDFSPEQTIQDNIFIEEEEKESNRLLLLDYKEYKDVNEYTTNLSPPDKEIL